MDRSNEDGGIGEIYEALAANAIAVAKDLGLPDDVVNVEDGEIAVCAENLIRVDDEVTEPLKLAR